MTLGCRIRELREAAKLSQEQLASFAGVSRNAVSLWETGRTKPSTARLSLVAYALKISLDDLLNTGKPHRRNIAETKHEFLKLRQPSETAADLLCCAIGTTRQEVDSSLGSFDALRDDVTRHIELNKLDKLQRNPPLRGMLATRLKHIFHRLLRHDLENGNVVRYLHSQAWISDVREQAHARHMIALQEIVISCFNEAAAAQGQIDEGNCRAASGLLIAAYLSVLRMTLCDKVSSERAISVLEPQIEIVLRGFSLKNGPSLSEGE